MTVTFHAAIGETTGFVISCMCETNRKVVDGGDSAAYEEALAALGTLRSSMVDCDCADLDVFITPITDGAGPTLNVTATNAHHLLAALFIDSGAPQGVCGSFDGDAFLARFDVASPFATDRPGCVAERLPELRRVAEHAASLGRKVVWG